MGRRRSSSKEDTPPPVENLSSVSSSHGTASASITRPGSAVSALVYDVTARLEMGPDGQRYTSRGRLVKPKEVWENPPATSGRKRKMTVTNNDQHKSKKPPPGCTRTSTPHPVTKPCTIKLSPLKKEKRRALLRPRALESQTCHELIILDDEPTDTVSREEGAGGNAEEGLLEPNKLSDDDGSDSVIILDDLPTRVNTADPIHVPEISTPVVLDKVKSSFELPELMGQLDDFLPPIAPQFSGEPCTLDDSFEYVDEDVVDDDDDEDFPLYSGEALLEEGSFLLVSGEVKHEGQLFGLVFQPSEESIQSIVRRINLAGAEAEGRRVLEADSVELVGDIAVGNHRPQPPACHHPPRESHHHTQRLEGDGEVEVMGYVDDPLHGELLD